MAIDLVTRREWGARSARGTPTRINSTKGVKVHYTGDRVDPRVGDDHGRCAGVVRGIQRSHMDGNEWIDIGYSLVVCPHRRVFEGRGPKRLPAANGPGLNSGHYAVLGLVGNSGLVVPPPAMLHGLRDAIEYLRERGDAGREIKGHRDGYATSCPGERLYAWVRAGAPRPEEDDMTPDEVWHDARIIMNKGEQGQSERSPAAFMQELETEQDRIKARLDDVKAQNARIEAKLDALAQREEAVDAEALVARIRAEIERVTARLDDVGR